MITRRNFIIGLLTLPIITKIVPTSMKEKFLIETIEVSEKPRPVNGTWTVIQSTNIESWDELDNQEKDLKFEKVVCDDCSKS